MSHTIRAASLLLLCATIFSYASAVRWVCHHWTEVDHAWGRRHPGQVEQQCERVSGRQFTGGNDNLAPGCGGCHCCKKAEWTCHHWDEGDHAWGRQHPGEWVEQCERVKGRRFTGGNNDLAPGCGGCYCCERVKIVSWCEYGGRYLSGYSRGVHTYSSLYQAEKQCSTQSDCGGVTYEPKSGHYTLRRGTSLRGSPSKEISWKKCPYA